MKTKSEIETIAVALEMSARENARETEGMELQAAYLASLESIIESCTSAREFRDYLHTGYTARPLTAMEAKRVRKAVRRWY